MVKELQRRQRIKRLIYSWSSLVLLLAFSVLMVKGAIGIFSKERESAQVVRELREEVLSVEERGKLLEEEIARLKTQEGIVDEIKRKFSVTKEGEYLAIVVEERIDATSVPTSTIEWLRKVWQGLIRIIR